MSTVPPIPYEFISKIYIHSDVIIFVRISHLITRDILRRLLLIVIEMNLNLRNTRENICIECHNIRCNVIANLKI